MKVLNKLLVLSRIARGKARSRATGWVTGLSARLYMGRPAGYGPARRTGWAWPARRPIGPLVCI